jgi:hypothetical protein
MLKTKKELLARKKGYFTSKEYLNRNKKPKKKK